MRALMLVLFLFISPLTAQAGFPAQGKQIIVVFRFDDYSSRSSTDIEVKIIEAFQKYNASLTLGVIPYVCARDYLDPLPQDLVPLTQFKANILNDAIKAGTLEIALHGYSHQTMRERGKYSEFFGLDYNRQLKRIAKGKYYLEKMLDTRITTFIPPFDSYDLNTIRALEDLKFKSISADVTGDAKEHSPLLFFPATCGLLQLRDAVKTARGIPEVQSFIICKFHEFDFLEVDSERGVTTYQGFVELLGWLTSQEDIYVSTINEAPALIADLSSRRFVNYNSYYKLSLLMPPFLSKFSSVPVGVYLSPKAINGMKIRLGAVLSIFYLVPLVMFFAIAFFGGLILFPRSELATSISKYGVTALLVLVLIYGLDNLVLGYRGALVIDAILGACMGVWCSVLKVKKIVVRGP